MHPAMRQETVSSDGQKRRPVLYGLHSSLPDSAFLNVAQITRRVGTNVGNLAFIHAIRTQLAGWGPTTTLGWNSHPSRINASGDVCVLPCANNLGAHVDMGFLADRISEISIPMVAIGLGAQTSLRTTIPELPEGTIRWLTAISRHAASPAVSNFAVRGDLTRRVLEIHGFYESCVVGCPSLFLNPDLQLGKSIGGNCRVPSYIGVTAGNPGWRHLAPIEHSLARLIDRNAGMYICQGPAEMVELSRSAPTLPDIERFQDCHQYIHPDLTLVEFQEWMQRHAVVFFAIPTWLEFLRRFDFVVGTRVHGISLAMQAGVPALCIAIDSRSVEMCRTMRLPYVVHHAARGILDETVIVDEFSRQFDVTAFDDNRRTLAARYYRFLVANDLKPAASLRTLSCA